MDFWFISLSQERCFRCHSIVFLSIRFFSVIFLLLARRAMKLWPTLRYGIFNDHRARGGFCQSRYVFDVASRCVKRYYTGYRLAISVWSIHFLHHWILPMILIQNHFWQWSYHVWFMMYDLISIQCFILCGVRRKFKYFFENWTYYLGCTKN